MRILSDIKLVRGEKKSFRTTCLWHVWALNNKGRWPLHLGVARLDRGVLKRCFEQRHLRDGSRKAECELRWRAKLETGHLKMILFLYLHLIKDLKSAPAEKGTTLGMRVRLKVWKMSSFTKKLNAFSVSIYLYISLTFSLGHGSRGHIGRKTKFNSKIHLSKKSLS